MQKKFYGWWITIFAFFTFGLAVGIPYYGGPFFYDYYEKAFGWSHTDTTLGFPIAATIAMLFAPPLVHRFSPRMMILIGTALTGVAYVGWSQMTGNLYVYYAFWVVYVTGYMFSGPIAHQVLISHWFRKSRGKAMAVTYLGVGVFGGLSAKFIAKPLTDALGFQGALMAIGGLMILAWPICLFLLKDKPSDIGQFPDGDAKEHAGQNAAPRSFKYLLSKPSFWLLVVGSFCSIGAIGSINQHMKFVFKEHGFVDQHQRDALFGDATFYILFSSIAGRLIMGYLADKFSKKIVMTVTYVMVAATIPLLLLVTPENPQYVYIFSILFGFGMGADYMLIPLMAAEQFGVNSLARAMAIILPTDTIGQTWCPWLVSLLHDKLGGYGFALNAVILLAFAGAISIALLPKKEAVEQDHNDETLPLQESERAAAKR